MPGGVGSGKPAGSSLDALMRAAEKDDLLLYLTAFLGVFMPGVVYFMYHCVHNIYSDYAQKREARRAEEEREKSAVTIFYASQGGRCATIAEAVAQRLAFEKPPVIDLATVEPEDFSSYKGIGVFVVSSACKGNVPESAEWFLEWLDEVAAENATARRRKPPQRPCCRIHFAVLGVGDSKYGDAQFNRGAKMFSRRLRAIGASPLCPLTLADQSKTMSLEAQADAWADTLLELIEKFPYRARRKKKGSWFGAFVGSTDDETSADSDDNDSLEHIFSFRCESNRSGRFGEAGQESCRATESSGEDSDSSRSIRFRKR